jgi:hypothetical protein
MTTQNSSQIGDTSMTEKPISSPMNKYDATIVTKTKSSEKTNCDHSSVFNDVNVTSLMTTSLLVIINFNFVLLASHKDCCQGT